MMLPFLSQRCSPIGLDVSGRWMKAVQLRGGTLSATARVLRADPEAPFGAVDAALLAGVLGRTGFSGSRAVLVAPREMIMSDVLELPPRKSGAPIDQLARLELARANKQNPMALELATWDLPAPGRGGDGSHVFAAALPADRAGPLLDALEEAGIEVQAIEPACNAAARACSTLCADAIVELGWHAAMLVVLHQGIVVYERLIVESGLRALYESLRTKQGLTDDVLDLALLGQEDRVPRGVLEEVRGPVSEHIEVLAREVQRSLVYTSHRYGSWRLNRMGIVGDGAEVAGVRERLAGAMEIKVDVARPSIAATLSGVGQSDHPSLVTALGAACHGRTSAKEAA